MMARGGAVSRDVPTVQFIFGRIYSCKPVALHALTRGFALVNQWHLCVLVNPGHCFGFPCPSPTRFLYVRTSGCRCVWLSGHPSVAQVQPYQLSVYIQLLVLHERSLRW